MVDTDNKDTYNNTSLAQVRALCLESCSPFECLRQRAMTVGVLSGSTHLAQCPPEALADGT